MINKTQRQHKILNLVRSGEVLSQLGLSQRLKKEGIGVTQATLSRDLRDLQLVKTSKGYRLPEALSGTVGDHSHLPLRQNVSQSMTEVTAAHNIVVVKTHPGNASSLALSLDNAGWKEIVGTVAGDDTIMVVTPDAGKARSLRKRLMALAAQ